jgi:hypothetical protein
MKASEDKTTASLNKTKRRWRKNESEFQTRKSNLKTTRKPTKGMKRAKWRQEEIKLMTGIKQAKEKMGTRGRQDENKVRTRRIHRGRQSTPFKIVCMEGHNDCILDAKCSRGRSVLFYVRATRLRRAEASVLSSAPIREPHHKVHFFPVHKYLPVTNHIHTDRNHTHRFIIKLN